MTPTVPRDAPSIREITDLIARVRHLTPVGCHADLAERAAFLADKEALIARITLTWAVRDADTATYADGAER